MHKGLFTRLALQNIRNNKRTYIPYKITCIFCIAMMYMMEFLRDCPNLAQAVPQVSEVRMLLTTGEVVVIIFCCIFLIYSNSFLMKRRQKEIGLYNILGLEKRHIGKILFLETVITAFLSIVAGIAFGILGSKLSLLLLLRILHVPSILGFYISLQGILVCLIMFGIIFLVILLQNMARVRMNQPIELLRGNNTGEREPKAKWLMALLGFICLGTGYFIAVTTESPLQASVLFLVAVLLVMAGTYLLFTAGSIVILKLMRRRKSFYYKTSNFISISGMFYRMKQNAVGLSSICILSTGVLLMISMSSSLYAGMNDIMVNRYPYEVDIDIAGISREEASVARNAFEQVINERQIPVDSMTEETYLFLAGVQSNYNITLNDIAYVTTTGKELKKAVSIYVIRQSEYAVLTGTNPNLSDGSVWAWFPGAESKKSLKINDTEFSVNKWLKDFPLNMNYDMIIDSASFVVTDNDFAKLDQMRSDAYKNVSAYPAGQDLSLHLGLNIDGSKQDQILLGTPVLKTIKNLKTSGQLNENSNIICGIRQQEYESYYADNGTLLFIGIFLGSLFLLGTAMIIYYKQISEGYEDQGRFEIMQKVGMSHKEVKSSIQRQILMVFFLPLLMAMIHISMAFPLIRRILLLFGMNNTGLFIKCTAITVLIFAVVYGIIYSITAKSYYRIVERK